MADVELPSNRSFALLFVVVFTVVAIWRHGYPDGWLWLALSIGFTLSGLFVPHALTPLNRAWMRFGLMLGRVVSPIVLGFMYVALIVPVGLVMRLIGRDVMQRRPDAKMSTYWREREKTTVDPEDFRNQY